MPGGGAVPRGTFPVDDHAIPAFLAGLGLDGMIDIHVHALPHRLQSAVWRYFDALDDPPWPIRYRLPEQERLERLAELGISRHTALAYAHRAGMAASLNEHTLALAEANERVIPTFTFYPEDGVAGYVATALERGGAVAKVHLQVGRFHATDARLDDVWRQLAAARTPVVIHAGAVYGVDGGEEYCGADEMRRLLDRHPDVRPVVAHLGAPDFHDFLDLAEEHPELCMDTAMAFGEPGLVGTFPYAELDRLRGMSDRLLFGSDFPSIPVTVAEQLRGLAALELDVAGLRGVLRGNAERLLMAGADPSAHGA